MARIKILEILPNPEGWREAKAIAGGVVRMMEINKRWSKIGVQIETVEHAYAPSLMYNQSYTVHILPIPFHKGNIMTDLVNLLVWTLNVIRVFTKWRREKKHYDAVIANVDISAAFHGWIASNLLRAPLIVIMQTIEDYTVSPLTSYRKFKSYGWSPFSACIKSVGDWLSSKFIRNAFAFICVSEPIAETLRWLGLPEIKIHVTGNGVDMDQINAITPYVKEYDAVFLGRIVKEKGMQDLLEAWRMLLREREDAQLIVVGVGDFLEKAKDLASEYGMRENVKFTGFVTEDDKYAYLKKSRMLVFPTKAVEGWGLVVAEAMACGLPVVCYNNPVVKSVFGLCKSVVFVPTGDVEKLAITLLQLLENGELLKEYGELSLECAKAYDWDNVAKRELEIIKKTLHL